MENPISFIVFTLILLLSIMITIISCIICGRWQKAYIKLKNKYDETKKENIKLQHDVYRLTYITPDVKTKKGEN